MLRASQCHQARAPVFPPEIFDHIIDLLDDQGADCFRSDVALRALKACSLVCMSFSQRALAHIFQHLQVTFDSTDCKRPFKLAAILENNPKLRLHVRKLTTTILDLHDVPKRVTETFLDFPSLTSLAIDDVTIYYDSNNMEAVFYRDLIHTYLASNTLTALELEREPLISFNDIMTCPHLQTLRLTNFRFGSIVLSGPSSAIRHLQLRKCDMNSRIPLSFLSRFPCLITLNIHGNFDTKQPTMEFASGGKDSPSFNLEKLHLNSTCNDGMHAVIEFYLKHARRQGVQAFNSLKELDVVVVNVADLDAVRSLLDDKPALRSLTINGEAYNSDTSFEDFDLQWHDLLLSSLATLTNLSLSFPPHFYSDWNYLRLMDLIPKLLSSIPSTNIVENINLHIQFHFSEAFERPLSVSAWNTMACTLASPSAFPCLKSVELSIRFVMADNVHSVNDARVDDFECGDLVKLKEELDQELQPLISRPGVVVRHVAFACTMWEILPDYLKSFRASNS